ncbi:unnamed protein product [Hyaloperonospora brassicae]|uniref:Non-specific serine/threonine protein kinase n=1 Tax=Hyaloperonospora brassicae TaxID=162125 RepID=A0AAV0U4V0_HYABA|nr:unnamed protein product [Hyaloperonospora brassicae]
MEVAVASLERSVRALFTPSTATNSAPAHALCECALEQVPPPDWQYLRRFPVLKRHVLREFRSVATEVAKMPPTPRKRAKRSTWQQRSDLDEYKAVCLASLCQKLAQCELFTRDEGEVLDAVVALESLAVLQRVIGGKLLPLRVRMLLLGWALRCQEKTCRETAVQQWIQQVGEKLLEELIEISASNESSQVLSVKRVRTRAACGKQVVERRESVRDDTSSCRFCRDGASADILWSKCGSGELLIACAQRTARVLEKAGESYATNKAMMALSAFWDLRPAARLISGGRTSRRRKHSEISSVMTEQPIEPSMTISAYREIGKAAARSAASATCAFQTMWTSVWERECKHMTQMEHITLVDAVRHCSKVDEFASMVMLPEARMRITHFPGFLVVLDVIESLSIDMSTIISAFAIVWDSTYAGAFLRSTTLTRTSTSPSRRILRSYLRELLKSRGLRHRAISSSSNTSSAWSRTSPLGLLFSLFEIFSEVEPGEQQDSSYFRQWDAFVSQASTEVSRTDCTQGGIAWCMFLEECVLSVGAKKTLTTSHRDMDFLRSFQRYCHTIMHGIVVTGGEVISSGGSIYRQLIRGEGDRLVVRRVLVRMMITFEETWTIDLIALLLRSSASFHISSKMDERGMIHLLFPALASFMKSTCGANVNERKTRQQQFAAIVNSINVVLKDSEPTASYLVQLMRFCEAWDVYQSSHTKEAPSKANRWGFHAMVELDVVAELLECYSKDDVIHQETRGALDFASEVLQSAPHCPPSLEGGLWRFLSAVKARTEEGLSTTSDLLDRELVSHSSNVLQRFLRAVRFADVAQTRQLMSQMKDTVGTFGELRQQLERWFSFVEVNGAAFAAKESRLELSVLCTRLIRWFPNEFEDMRFLLMTPLDPHLVFTLKAFVKEAGKLNGKTHRSKLSSAATSLSTLAVRIEMALHSYLSAAALPDLETLSVLLVKAVVKCRSPDAFDDLTKVIQKNSRVLLPETAVATLSSPLRGLEFSNCAIQQNEDNDDGRMALRAQRAKSIIYQENTLKLLARSASIFDGGLSWSSALFNVQSAVTYLPILFDYVLQTGFCDGALQADLLLTCLNELRQQADGGARVLREAYWIAAVLHTALMSGSRRIAGAYAISNNDVLDRLRTTTGDVLQLLSIAANTTAAPTGCNIDGATTQLDEVLCLLKLSKVARLAIADNRASCYWSCERLISDKAHRALQTVVSSAWTAATNRAQDMAVMPAMQLFVPFASWLTAALVYSQSFLEDPSAHVRRWERTFTGYVTDLYLHLEFEDVTGDLLETWLTTWITANIVRGQDEVPLLALLPSQVALFRRLASTPYREIPPGERNRTATSIWRLVFAALNVAVDTREEQHPVELGQAVELILHTLTTLELVELSASSDFVHCSHEATVEPFFQELERFLLQLHRRVGSVAQVCCLLQYPLELLVCCYVCNMAVHCNAESQRFLQRVRDLLQANVENIGDVLESIDDDRKLSTVRDPSRQSDSDKEHGESQSQLSATSQSADIEAFFHLWADEMALKYDYVDQERCKAMIEVIQAALHVSEHAPNRKTVSVETGPRDG